MIRKQKFKLLLLLLLVGMQLFASDNGADKAGWELAKYSDGISLYYRWIEQGDLKTREMKAEFEIEAGIPEIISHFNNSESYEIWAAGIKECKIEKTNDSIWFAHTVMNYPFPFKQKDLVTRHQVETNGENATIKIDAAPNFFSELNGIERMKNYEGYWVFTTTEEGNTKVDYRVISYTKPMFPRFIQDPVVQKLCINSFSELKQLAENR